jgi:hypothetical protein
VRAPALAVDGNAALAMDGGDGWHDF